MAAEPQFLRPPLPCEDPERGLYIHQRTETTPGTRVTVIEDSESEPRVLVHAEDFMEVQRERDEYKRALALINGERVGSQDWGKVARILDRAGFTVGLGRAVNDIAAAVRGGRL